MSWQPLHEIKIEHDWQEIRRTEVECGTFTIFERCQACGETRRALGLSTVDRPRLSKKKRLARDQQLAETVTRALDAMEEQHRKLVEGTEYEDLPSLLEGIDLRYDRTFLAGELPMYQLEMWIETSNKKFRRKLLLLFKQGQVCNRCDRIALSSDDLTVDHIRPRSEGGGGELTNLQLLCGPCNKEKDNKGPNDLDVSPFDPSAKACRHQISCTELGDPRLCL